MIKLFRLPKNDHDLKYHYDDNKNFYNFYYAKNPDKLII